MLNETVNPGTGSVRVRVGVPVPAGRAFNVPFTFAYDSTAAMYMTAIPASGGTTTFEWVDD